MAESGSTALQLMIDRSGSMHEIRDDAEGGIRAFLQEQRALPGKCTLRVAQFDDRYEVVHDSMPIADAPDPALHPRGSTALLDAWGQTMSSFVAELNALPENERPEHVIFVVVTDGKENASREWTYESVNKLVTSLSAPSPSGSPGWQFLFLAANQDAVKEGARLGVRREGSLTYGATGQGVAASYSAASASVTRTRSGHGGGFTESERRSAQQG